MQYYHQLLEQITTGTDSSLILFFVIVAGLMMPMYYLMLRERKSSRQHELEVKAELKKYEVEKHDKFIEREKEIINVVKENSAVISDLRGTIRTLEQLVDSHNKDFKDSIIRIHDRIDESKGMTTEILTILKTSSLGVKKHEKT